METKMTSFYKITAYNSQALYFWGTDADVDRYVDWLNRDREINVYAAEAIPEAEWAQYEGRDDVLSGEECGWDDFMSAEA
ncbi:hypothetical protein U717_04120 [Rhodobacter capsulatus R121]|nr:Chain A, Anti-CRISPR protein Type I-C9 [Rhodobacter capsulatus DE442]8HJJ_B Chain B, Anti-CRISPR protein Type I-C9 [Rhodobacter capsulatus DE442]8HJJ_C Chain C, Anti-CRISPR protein Type I-C9 [Rhodobacter capsulatus DE442]ETD79037.1 hypothetical protein U717_04120 [Rhodobacter capsulatus R121]ETE54952.1 hypothetical protein U715_04110 [Rhodobacter capsulatus Y262]ETD02882.1 hypothetical protein U714_04115 [Rhodobacter capsulatus DE442]